VNAPGVPSDSSASDLPPLSELLARVAGGEDLDQAGARAAFTHVMAGTATPVQMAALLVGLRVKGHAPSEVAGGVEALRGAMRPVPAPEGRILVDTCGTGGGGLTTFNISTAAALVASGAAASRDFPLAVAKHGNRSFTSRSGSADILEALGVRIELTPEGMGRVLAEVGIVFMFAPLLHPAMRHVGPVRRELGVPTIMNLLGPLTNPAGVRRQVVGVSDPELVPLVVEALSALGHDRALVVHGEPGLDEMSILGATRVAELTGGEVRHRQVTPEAAGLETGTPAEIAGGSPEENARLVLEILEGRVRGGARNVTLLNAAAALEVAGAVESLAEGVAWAAQAVDSGAARDQLEALREGTQREGARQDQASSGEGEG
jgi:anthranilate phosphoribosyltransferase